MNTTEKIVTIKAKAFSGENTREHKIMVGSDGSVRVWDGVAGHYTTCHSLSRAAINVARKLAR